MKSNVKLLIFSIFVFGLLSTFQEVNTQSVSSALEPSEDLKDLIITQNSITTNCTILFQDNNLQPPSFGTSSVDSQWGLNAIPNISGALFPLTNLVDFQRKTEKIHKIKNSSVSFRNKIHSLITEFPGIHYNDICKNFKSKNGVTQYHLLKLEKDNYIKSYIDGGFHRYFPNTIEFSNSMTLKVLSAMNRDSSYSILAYLCLYDEPLTNYELSKLRDSSIQSVSANCKQLTQNQIIIKTKINRKNYYSISDEIKSLVFDLMPYIAPKY